MRNVERGRPFCFNSFASHLHLLPSLDGVGSGRYKRRASHEASADEPRGHRMAEVQWPSAP